MLQLRCCTTVLPEEDERYSTPTHDMDDDAVESTEFEYSDRPSGSWVVSGKLGVRFESWKAAEIWARRKYGKRYIRPVPELDTYGKWGFLIRGANV